MQQATETPMRILSFRIVNFERVELVELDDIGGVVTLGGDNEAGKTSTLNALRTALEGVDNRKIRKPVRDGSEKAEVYIVLGDDDDERYHVEAVIKPSGQTEYKITAPLADGSGFGRLPGSARKAIDAIVGAISFDPIEWARADDKKQAAMICEAFGLDFSDLDDTRTAAYDRRTEYGREVKRLAALVASVDVFPGVGRKLVTVTELSTELGDAGRINAENAAARRELELSVARLAHTERLIEDAENNKIAIDERAATASKGAAEFVDAAEVLEEGLITRARLAAELADIDEAIVTQRDRAAQSLRFERELASYNAQLDVTTADLARFESTRGTDANAVEALTAGGADRADIDPEPIRARIADADATNTKIRSNIERAKNDEALTAERAKVSAQTDIIGECDTTRADRFAAVDFPVEGLSFSADGGILYKGNPVKQAGAAREMEISMSVAMAQNPKLRSIFLRDASLLTKKSMERALATAKAKGYQVFVEDARADEDSASVLWLTDGTVRDGGAE